MGWIVALSAWLGWAGVAPGVVSGQMLDVTPNLMGAWTPDRGVVHFHVLHRFQVLDPPSRKVINTPTLLLAAGVANDAMVGVRYASSSLLVVGEPNEWEAYGRWSPLSQDRAGLDGAVRAGWNGTARSVDGEVAAARRVGPVRVLLAARAFSAWRGDGSAAAVAGGVVWRVHRWVALAADASQLLEGEAEAGWSAGLQLGIPYTPHTMSLHASNVNATTMQSASVGVPDRRLWGFEFTVPITLSRYFGGDRSRREASGEVERASTTAVARAAGASDTVHVTMDNRLRFLPDTVRVSAGQAVRWENTSDIIHTVTADPGAAVEPGNVRLPDGAAPFDSGDLLPGRAFVHVFQQPGTYEYVCVPHEMAGMIGVVIVDEGG